MQFTIPKLRDVLEWGLAATRTGAFLKKRLRWNSKARLYARYQAADWTRQNYPEMKRLMAGHKQASQSDAVCKLFCYWGQGFESAPAIVQTCHKRLIELHGLDNVISLHDGNLHEFVSLPKDVHEDGKKDRTAFSDLLRFALLAQKGGIWVDATILCRLNLYDMLPEIRGGGYFVFSQIGRKARISSWFMYADKNHYIPSLLEKAMLLYWQQGRPIKNYFMLYDIFEALYFLDADFRKCWSDVVPRNRKIPRNFYPLYFNEYDPQSFKTLWEESFLHKLTYKLKSEPRAGTMLGHLLANTAHDTDPDQKITA
jgi:hypothetical protein